MSDDALVDAFRGPSYEEVDLAERIRQSVRDELQDPTVDVTVRTLIFDPRGHSVILGVSLNGKRFELVTTQRTDSAESSRFLVAMFRRVLERQIEKMS